MITQNGRTQLLKLVSGKSYKFANLFVVGSSNLVLPSTATQLDFGWASVSITDSYVDEINNQVVFHGSLGSEYAGDVLEVGLISQSEEFVRSGIPSTLVYGFDPTENWFSDTTFDINTNSSVGPNNYVLNNAVASNFLAKLVNNISIAQYDTMKLRLNSTAVNGIRVYMKNDEANYAYKDITLTNGANAITQSIATFTKVGTFDPNKIFEIRFEIRSTTNATNSIEFDAINLTSVANGGLVARGILATKQYKRQGATMEIEYGVSLA